MTDIVCCNKNESQQDKCIGIDQRKVLLESESKEYFLLQSESKKYFIVSLDGGGVRCALQIVLLKRLCQAIPKLENKVCLVAGTSAGALVGSAFGSLGCDAMVQHMFNQEFAKKIFSESWRREVKSMRGLYRAAFSQRELENLLINVFGANTPLNHFCGKSDNRADLLITSFRAVTENMVQCEQNGFTVDKRALAEATRGRNIVDGHDFAKLSSEDAKEFFGTEMQDVDHETLASQLNLETICTGYEPIVENFTHTADNDAHINSQDLNDAYPVVSWTRNVFSSCSQSWNKFWYGTVQERNLSDDKNCENEQNAEKVQQQHDQIMLDTVHHSGDACVPSNLITCQQTINNDADNQSEAGKNSSAKPKCFGDPWHAEIYETLSKTEQCDTTFVQALCRSTAAPTYFPISDGCVDGGLVAQNPAILAITHALKHKQNLQLDDIVVLSIGTGQHALNMNYYGEHADLGVAQWVPNLLSAFNDGYVSATDLNCRNLLGERYIRLQTPLPQNIDLADYGAWNKLVQLAEQFPLDNIVKLLNKCL